MAKKWKLHRWQGLMVAASGGVAAVIAALITGHGSPGPTPPTTPPPIIKITSPTTGTIVDTAVISVAGTTAAPLAAGQEIWVIVQPEKTGRYYPQQPPAAVTASGGWNAPTVVLGGTDTFQIAVIDADQSVIAAFKAYLQQNQHSFPGMVSLPPGAQIADSVTIARK